MGDDRRSSGRPGHINGDGMEVGAEGASRRLVELGDAFEPAPGSMPVALDTADQSLVNVEYVTGLKR